MNKQKPIFRKGMKVKKIFHGIGGYIEESEGVVSKVSKGVAFFEDEWGTTYDAYTGRELENFFPPMWVEIKPI